MRKILYYTEAKMPNIIELIDKIEHVLNPLHVYCRLVEFGYDKKRSLSACGYYEKTVYRVISMYINIVRRIKKCRIKYQGR